MKEFVIEMDLNQKMLKKTSIFKEKIRIRRTCLHNFFATQEGLTKKII